MEVPEGRGPTVSAIVVIILSFSLDRFLCKIYLDRGIHPPLKTSRRVMVLHFLD